MDKSLLLSVVKSPELNLQVVPGCDSYQQGTGWDGVGKRGSLVAVVGCG